MEIGGECQCRVANTDSTPCSTLQVTQQASGHPGYSEEARCTPKRSLRRGDCRSGARPEARARARARARTRARVKGEGKGEGKRWTYSG